MKKSKDKNSIKDTIKHLGQKDLSKLALDLYALSKENARFIEARFGSQDEILEQYRKIITDAVSPDIYSQKPVRLSVGKKAISDYFKATKDKQGRLELMVHYLEKGNDFAVAYGDLEYFHSSLISMLERILSELHKEGEPFEKLFLPRIEAVIIHGAGQSWGYSDTIEDLLYEYIEMKNAV